MKGESLAVTQSRTNGHVSVSASGDLIITNANRLQHQIDQLIENGESDIILDLTGIQYMDSFGIGVVVKTKSELDKMKGSLQVIVNHTLMELLEKCRLDDYIDLQVEEKEEGAVD